MPMTGAQRRDLPHACRDLSAMLTTERGMLARSYWAAPRLTSAYLRFFFPWNIVRLASLLPSLDLGRVPERPLILDLGSGPLTLPIALWLARPDLRSLPVTIVASDTSPHILDLGKSIFSFLRDRLDSASSWTVRTMRSPAALALRKLHAKPGELWLLSMANVLNEMDERRPRSGQRIDEQLRLLLEDAHAMLSHDGRVLAVEPGTRQGGRLIALLRRVAQGGEEGSADDYDDEEMSGRFLEEDREDEAWTDPALPVLFYPASPCVHASACPMLARGVSAWCHFNAPAPHAPGFLKNLSARAGMDKESVSLSFLLLKKLDESAAQPEQRPRGVVPARVVSDAFSVPGLPGAARYACTPLGLALIPDALRLRQGELCRVHPTREKDAKSRACIMLLDDGRAQADRRPPRHGAAIRDAGHHRQDDGGKAARERGERHMHAGAGPNRFPREEKRRKQAR